MHLSPPSCSSSTQPQSPFSLLQPQRWTQTTARSANQPMSMAAGWAEPIWPFASKRTIEDNPPNYSWGLWLTLVCTPYGVWGRGARIHHNPKHIKTRTRQGREHAQDFLPTSSPFLLLPVSVVSTTQTHLGTHGSPRVLRANATHEAAVPAVQPYFSLRVTEKGRSFFVGDEGAVCPCLAQNVPPAAPCHVCKQRWHSLPEAW